MKNQNAGRGFVSFLIIAVVSILAISAGAYVVKNKEARLGMEPKTILETQANTKANIEKGKGSLLSFLDAGKDMICNFSTTENSGIISSGTFYLNSSGKVRADFTTEMSTGSQTSSMIIRNGFSYIWSGNQGTKMSTINMNSASRANTEGKKSLDLYTQLSYECENWSNDDSKFIIPTSVTFLDVDAMIKVQGN